MRIVIASGKGGTGKTTLATNLSARLAEREESVAYFDCDVEAPNGHLFLHPSWTSERVVVRPVPEVDNSRCTHCKECSKACRFSALVGLPDHHLVFPELCHGCGGCILACAYGAIKEVGHPCGKLQLGQAGELDVVSGTLTVGQASAVPMIRAVLDEALEQDWQIVDAPPGSACGMLEAVRDAHAVLLVTEPTPFGLADLKQAVAVVKDMGLPLAVAVNRVGTGDRQVWDWCAEQDIQVIFEQVYDERIARAYARGELAQDVLPEMAQSLDGLAQGLLRLSRQAKLPRPRQDEVDSLAGLEPIVAPSAHKLEQVNSNCRELVIVSGKGGTGKTSVCASFASLARNPVVADCDVDAADLHLVLDPARHDRFIFSAGQQALVDPLRCCGCGECEELCRFGAIDFADCVAHVDPMSCEGCGVCVDHCPIGVISLHDTAGGWWSVGETRVGPLVDASLAPTRENSGKLVTTIRKEARALAGGRDSQLVLVDASPGIGCPVIASLTTADLALVVAEPTPAGLHDARRVLQLAEQLRVNAALCVNKSDLHPEGTKALEQLARQVGVPMLGHIRYDQDVTKAQIARRAVVEESDGPAAQDMRHLWSEVRSQLGL